MRGIERRDKQELVDLVEDIEVYVLREAHIRNDWPLVMGSELVFKDQL